MSDGIIKLRTTESFTTATATGTDPIPTMESFLSILETVRAMRAKHDEQLARERATLSTITCEYCGRNIKPLDDGSYLICRHIWRALKNKTPDTPTGQPMFMAGALGGDITGIRFVVDQVNCDA